jgi:hypothetical protein
VLLMLESLHRRIAYLEGRDVKKVTDVARLRSISSNVLLNQARRQVVPAFRERGMWKIAQDY